MTADKDSALLAPAIESDPGPEYASRNRKYQGIPSVERTSGGKLYAGFYSGGEDEGPDNYVVLVTSCDDGRTWTEPVLVIDPPGKVRAFDPCLWMDPFGKLWLFWAQSYNWFDGRCGVFAVCCPNSDAAIPNWSKPRRIANGIMMNKPTVLSTGEWLLPIAVWASVESELNRIPDEMFSSVYISTDRGETFRLHGKAIVPDRRFDEHMILERNDGSLRMLVRTYYGIGHSFSQDRGKTWTPGRNSGIAGPDSRFFIRRLKSGRLLLVNHVGFTGFNGSSFSGRNNLTALLSEDDGETWISPGLLLDGRTNVSYPDATQADDGRIYIVYDRERYADKEILLAVVMEEDILEGRLIMPGSRLNALVSKAFGKRNETSDLSAKGE